MTESTKCHHLPLDRFLHGSVSPEEEARIERHLDHCEKCQQAIQEAAADRALWRETRHFLHQTKACSASAGTEQLVAPECKKITEQIALSILQASDDPQMLGRFANYEISEVIGIGGMGIVLKGFDPALQRFVAIKVLAPHLAACDESRQRFSREGQAAAAVVHENVIGIYGVDVWNNLPYLVMPYVRGESLQKRLDRGGPMSPVEIVRIGMLTASGLHAAHQQGLVHRDIKPANILLPEGVERVLITDFGLARAVDDSRLTHSTVIAGTPQYMSPEQTVGAELDGRSDLFSLGAMMYAMCIGHPPFMAETSYGVLQKIRDAEPMAVHRLNNNLPGWLWTVIERLLSKRPEDRFGDASTVAQLLRQCLLHIQSPDVPLPVEISAFSYFRHRVWGLARSWTRTVAAILVTALCLAWAGRQFGSSQPDPAIALSSDEAKPSIERVSYNYSFESEDPYQGWQRDKQDTRVLFRTSASVEELKRFGKKYLQVPGEGGVQQMISIAPEVRAQLLTVFASRVGGWSGAGVNYRRRNFDLISQYKVEIAPTDAASSDDSSLVQATGANSPLVHYSLPVHIPPESYYAEIWCCCADEKGSVTLDNLSLFNFTYPSPADSTIESLADKPELIANGRFTRHPEAQVTGFEFWEPLGDALAGLTHIADPRDPALPGRLQMGQLDSETTIRQTLALAANVRYELRVEFAEPIPAPEERRSDGFPGGDDALNEGEALCRVRGILDENEQPITLLLERLPPGQASLRQEFEVVNGVVRVEIEVSVGPLGAAKPLLLEQVSLRAVGTNSP